MIKIAAFLCLPMANLVLATSNHESFFSSTWSAWASGPHDLLLVTEVSVLLKLASMKYPQDGNVGAHCGILLPLSRYRSSILEAPTFAGPIQVIKTKRFSPHFWDIPDIRHCKSCQGGTAWNKHQGCGGCEGSDLLWYLSAG